MVGRRGYKNWPEIKQMKIKSRNKWIIRDSTKSRTPVPTQQMFEEATTGLARNGWERWCTHKKISPKSPLRQLEQCLSVLIQFQRGFAKPPSHCIRLKGMYMALYREGVLCDFSSSVQRVTPQRYDSTVVDVGESFRVITKKAKYYDMVMDLEIRFDVVLTILVVNGLSCIFSSLTQLQSPSNTTPPVHQANK